MNPELEKLLIAKLSGQQQINQSPPTTINDQLGSLYEQIQKKSYAEKLEKSFNQLLTQGKVGSMDDESFEQSGQKLGLKSAFKKDNLVTALGLTMASSIGGVFSGFLNIGSIGLGIAGIPQMAGGLLLSKVGGSSISRFANGVFLSGLAQAVGGFTGGLNLGGILGGGSTGSNAIAGTVE